MSIFENDTNYNPLYLEDATGLDADFDEAVLMDDTAEYLANKHNTGIYDPDVEMGDYYE